MPMTVPYAAIAPSRVAPARVRPHGMRNCSSARSAARSRSFSASGAARAMPYAPGHPGRVRLPDTAPALPVKRVKRRVRRAGGQQLPTQQRKAGPGHSLRRKTQQEQAARRKSPDNTLARVNGGQLPKPFPQRSETRPALIPHTRPGAAPQAAAGCLPPQARAARARPEPARPNKARPPQASLVTSTKPRQCAAASCTCAGSRLPCACAHRHEAATRIPANPSVVANADTDSSSCTAPSPSAPIRPARCA